MDFSPSEVRNLIKVHRTLFVSIADISCALEDEKKWIQLTVDNLSRIQKRENGLIKLNGNDHSVYRLMLLRQLSAYLRIEKIWEAVNQLDRLNHGKIDTSIREANNITGGLRRLFLTSTTRERANVSCRYLQTLLEGEYRKLIENAHDGVYAAREETKERNDFSEDEVNECSRTLENLWPGTVYPDDYPEEIPAVRDRLIMECR